MLFTTGIGIELDEQEAGDEDNSDEDDVDNAGLVSILSKLISCLINLFRIYAYWRESKFLNE